MKKCRNKLPRFLALLLFPAILLLLAAGILLHGLSAENKRFETFTGDLFRSEVSASTISLHYTLADPRSCDISDAPITFGRVSADNGEESYAAALENHAAALSSFEESKLSSRNRLTLSILRQNCRAQQDCSVVQDLQEPLSPSLGVQAQLPVLLAEYTFRSRQDILDYLELLKSLPSYFQDIMALEQKKSENGLFMNDNAADGIISQCRSFIENPEQNYLISVFNEKLEAVSELTGEERSSCKALHEKLIASAVIPAYEQLIEGLQSLKGSGKNVNGLAYLPGGKSYYTYLLRTQVGTEDSVTAVEERLYKQLLADSKELQNLLSENPSLLLAEEISDDSQDASQEPSDILEELQTCMSGDFPSLPETAYEVKYVHKDLQEFLSPAFYLTPPVDTNSPNAIYINPHSNMEGTELFTTLAHEGFPGHLYQTVYFSGTNPPLIRHLYEPGGYIEGWATYVESYAYTYAGGSADRNRLLWLNRSMNLCLYSLMDVGIHDHGWTLENTASFLRGFGIDSQDTAAQIFEYIVETPANYLKYYYGYLNFLDIREACREAKGESFDLKDFHKKLLELGPMPFSILRRELSLET